MLLLKPLLPYAADLAAHIFRYSGHVATVHYEHGKYHVHYEIDNLAKKENQEKNNSGFLPGDNSKEYLLSIKSFPAFIPESRQSGFPDYASCLAGCPVFMDERPPQAI